MDDARQTRETRTKLLEHQNQRKSQIAATKAEAEAAGGGDGGEEHASSSGGPGPAEKAASPDPPAAAHNGHAAAAHSASPADNKPSKPGARARFDSVPPEKRAPPRAAVYESTARQLQKMHSKVGQQAQQGKGDGGGEGARNAGLQKMKSMLKRSICSVDLDLGATEEELENEAMLMLKLDEEVGGFG